jgi:pimeloyl-ACP methyl ester carboxylesterase
MGSRLPWVRWKDEVAARLQAGGQVAQTARGPIGYATAGEGAAVLVSHGTPGGYDQGLAMAELFGAGRLRFLAVSRPGYPGTPLEVGRTPEEQADAFAALLDALGVGRAAVIGLSGGGPSALQFALRHPERCWALVLIAAITRNRPASQRPLGWKLLHSVILRSDFGGWLACRLVRGLTRAAPRRPGGRVGPDLFRRFAESTVPYSLRGAGHANDSAQFGLLPSYPLGDIRRPTLVVHGTADGPVPFAHAEFAAGTIPGAQLIAVAGAGHGSLFRSEGLAAKVVAFLEAHAPAG